jgi:hypothetical protein
MQTNFGYDNGKLAGWLAGSVAQIQFSSPDSPSLTRDLPFPCGNCLVSLPRLLTAVIKNTGDCLYACP